jgi:hypothetical protein
MRSPGPGPALERSRGIRAKSIPVRVTKRHSFAVRGRNFPKARRTVAVTTALHTECRLLISHRTDGDVSESPVEWSWNEEH